MSEQHFMQIIDKRLRAMVTLSQKHGNTWLLDVELFYDGSSSGNTSFNLNGYSESEAVDIARNIRGNAYLMKEIDEFLWGESD